ncbi:SRPBCC family protein [Gynurincola endophyticus]|uniref:SRPBCC family protein n=1 Tax=Gynurincola endophyticus TaxID=2479004 RepID=UPI000F8E4172|nr:SRPBCC family protein [Gynurincola endophyticus]
MQNLGKISKENEGYKVIFDRILLHPVDRVWKAITDPDQLKYWFTDITFDFRPGGQIVFQFRDEEKTKSYGEIVSIDVPNRFVWTWEGELAVWELTALDEYTTRLLFTYSKINGDYAVNVASGFHDILQLLENRLAGSEAMSPFGATANAPEFLPIRTRYAAAVYTDYPEIVQQPPVVIEKVLKAPVEKIWAALTNKEQMLQWYFSIDDFKPEPGFEFRFAGEGSKGDHYMHRCVVTEVNPLSKLQYSWQYEGYTGYSLVTFELFPQKNGTRISVSHQGLESFPQELADFTRNSFTQGWTDIIGKMLPDYLQKD